MSGQLASRRGLASAVCGKGEIDRWLIQHGKKQDSVVLKEAFEKKSMTSVSSQWVSNEEVFSHEAFFKKRKPVAQ